MSALPSFVYMYICMCTVEKTLCKSAPGQPPICQRLPYRLRTLCLSSLLFLRLWPRSLFPVRHLSTVSAACLCLYACKKIFYSYRCPGLPIRHAPTACRFVLNRAVAIAAAAWLFIFSRSCSYICVVTMLLCLANCWTSCNGIPAFSDRVTAVCLRL